MTFLEFFGTIVYGLTASAVFRYLHLKSGKPGVGWNLILKTAIYVFGIGIPVALLLRYLIEDHQTKQIAGISISIIVLALIWRARTNARNDNTLT